MLGGRDARVLLRGTGGERFQDEDLDRKVGSMWLSLMKPITLRPVSSSTSPLISSSITLYSPGDAFDFLRELGLDTLGPEQTAARVTLARSRLSYERGLALIDEWLDELASSTSAADLGKALEELRQRRILRDRDGEWCRPSEGVLSIPGVPPLPGPLYVRELADVRHERARALLRRLGVRELDAPAALTRVSRAVEEGHFATTEAEKREPPRLALAPVEAER